MTLGFSRGAALLAISCSIPLFTACDNHVPQGAGLANAAESQGKADPPTRQASATTPPPQSPQALPSGFTAQETAALVQGVRAIVLGRQYDTNGMGFRDAQMCTDVFDVGQPSVVDASLSGQTGRVQVAVPITGQRPIQFRANVIPPQRFPSGPCYGVADESMWSVGRTIAVTFEYRVERWQSGWRLAQN